MPTPNESVRNLVFSMVQRPWGLVQSEIFEEAPAADYYRASYGLKLNDSFKSEALCFPAMLQGREITAVAGNLRAKCLGHITHEATPF